MNKIQKLLLSLLLSFSGGVSFAQNGLENIIVEKYYVSNAADAAGSVGALPAGSVTYRIFADMLPGYNFQALYGVAGHTLLLNTSSLFFNNEDRGNTNPSIGAAFINDNSVALDSWFSVGGAANGNLGILKSEDNGAANLIMGNPILLNADTSAGIPLTTQDGIITGTPVSVTFVGVSTELNVFNALSNVGNSFSTTNGSIAALGGSSGPVPATNRVLVGQFTTDGTFHFELNVQIGTPTGGTQSYVASNPSGSEISIPSLIFTSTPGIPMANSSISYCVGNTALPLTASASQDCNLNWYTVSTGGASGATAPTPSTAAAGSTTYYVSQTNSAGKESGRTPITVTINSAPPVPVITVSGTTTFCAGGSALLISSATAGNTWSTTATTDSITAVSTGSYGLTVINGFGCSSNASPVNITVNPLPPAPVISASGPVSFCNGGSVILTSSATSGNMWLTTETTSSINITTSGNYSVTETDINGCSSTSTTTTVSVNAVPVAIGGVTSTTGSVVSFSNASTGATSYFWDFGDLSTSTSSTPVHTYGTNGNYVVTLVAMNGGCSDTITFNTSITTGVSADQSTESIKLYPNPAIEQAVIDITLTESISATVKIFDMTGKNVMNAFEGTLNSGVNAIKINTSDLPEGIYFTKLTTTKGNKTIKLVVLK